MDSLLSGFLFIDGLLYLYAIWFTLKVYPHVWIHDHWIPMYGKTGYSGLSSEQALLFPH